jgi:protein O-mannosyl-transferase
MSKNKKNTTAPKTPIKASTSQSPKQARQTAPKSVFFKENTFNLIILGVLAFGLYISTVRFDYALDDTMVITGNKFTQRGFSGIGDIFRYESFRGYFGEQKNLLEGDRYRPLSIATFAAEVGLFGSGNKAAGHFINILLYILTAIMLYRVLLFMFPNKNKEENDSKIQQLFTVPFIATALFIAHPLHVEVVANIKGRDEILALLGELGTLYFTFRYLNEKTTQNLFSAFAMFLIAIFSKESAITFLAVVPLTAHFFTNASFGEKMKMTLPVLAGTLFYLMMRVNAIGFVLGSTEVTDLMNNPFYGMSFGDRLATIFYTLLLYLKLHLLPHPLTHDYYPFHIPKMSWTDWQSILSLVLHIGLVAVILRGWQKRTVWAYSAAFYLVTLSIVSNLFVSVGTFMNERFVYHASLGFCIAVAYLLTAVLDKNGENSKKIMGLGIAALLVIGFSIKTLMRVPDWYSGATLNASAMQNSPNSARANCFYGISIWEDQFLKLPATATRAQKMALLIEMRPYFRRSLEILPKYSAAVKMMAGVAGEFHKIDNDLDVLLKDYDHLNRTGVYEPFIGQYLTYLNGKVSTKIEGEKLVAFYSSMIAFFKQNNPSSVLPNEYQKLLDGIQGRMGSLL